MPFRKLSNYEDWNGFYHIPVNKESYYHVKASGDMFLVWNEPDLGIMAECPAKMTSDVKALASTVNMAKKHFSSNGQGGGKFVINEFGHVIVPYKPDDYHGYLPKKIGNWNGIIEFEGPYGLFSLKPKTLKTGDDWTLPYIGIKYQLHWSNSIYFYHRVADFNVVVRSPKKDISLINKLREIRTGRKGASFIVNNYGAVITKVEENGIWKRKFIGSINYNEWFDETQVSNPDF